MLIQCHCDIHELAHLGALRGEGGVAEIGGDMPFADAAKATREASRTSARFVFRVNPPLPWLVPKNLNVAETASRWSRDGKIFAVKVGGEVRVPSFQFVDGRPRPEIARVLSALPEQQRSGWPAAFWFASDTVSWAAPHRKLSTIRCASMRWSRPRH